MSAVIIPARYHSTRLMGKPLKKIAGIPMIVWTANNCLKSKADRVIVVTDHEEILSACAGIDRLESTMSSPDIRSGTDRVAKVAKYLNDDVVINVQGDEPFIDYNIINTLIDDIAAGNSYMNSACVKIGEAESADPNIVKVVRDKFDNALYFSRSVLPYYRDTDAGFTKNYFKHIGIYGFKRKFLLDFAGLEESSLEKFEKLEQLRALENGYKIRVIETDYSPISVDTEEDLITAERYAREVYNV